MEGKRNYIFVFFDFVLFREVFGNFEWGKSAAVFFEDVPVMNADKAVFVGVTEVGFPRDS